MRIMVKETKLIEKEEDDMKGFMHKKVAKSTWSDMVKGSAILTVVVTSLAALPFIGYLIKEALD